MSKRRSGFSLIEMMVVVTIMGSMAALLAPGIGEFLADARAAGVSEDLVRMSRHIRARSQSTGLAHLMLFSSTSNDTGGLGRILVYEGMTNHCRQTPWPQALDVDAATLGHAPVDGLDLRDRTYNPIGGSTAPSASDGRRQVIRLHVPGTGDQDIETISLCIEPSGASLQGTADSSNTGFTFVPQLQPITFNITRSVDGDQRGSVRRVVFQPSGIARFRY